MSISRRTFLEGALVAGGVATAGMLAGCAGETEQKASTPSDAQAAKPTRDDIAVPHTTSEHVASFDMCTFDVEDPAPLDPPETWDKEVDIVVAGTGGGLAGAARAAYLGNSVLALEVSDTYGGVSKSACLYYFATGTKSQTKAGLPDLSEALIAQTLAAYPKGEKYPKHVSNCIHGMQDLIAWTEELGMEWEPGWIDGEQKVAMALAPKGSQESGNSYRMLTAAEDFYNDVFTKNGGEYLFNTPITGLVMENGRVIGAQATPKDGEPLFIKANKGVILATGGMCNNIEMLKRYCPSGFYRCMVSNASTNDNGDGIRLGFGAGAQFDGFNNHGHFDGGIEGVDWNHMLYAADIQIARQPWLQMDTRGDRVVYDISSYEDTGAQIMAMPESKVFSFFDANWEQYCEGFVLPMCRNLTKPDMVNQERWNGTLDPDYRNGVKSAIEEGRIKQGNTPEELAEAMGIAPEFVVNAFKEWNEMVASGDGSAYGYQPEWLHPLDTPPYYGQALGAMMYSSRAGLSIDENQQVIARNGLVIPGLYASGQTSGRPATCVCGDVGYAAVSAFNAANHLDANA
ncbi:FAD-binding protein [Eggerthella sp. YY7918]|uniref:FAD-binding protein n=1 Tax=Eggerthella sp. (strain YY7918) TaxID=502558 RepID=UPI0002171616|nr:FAD-binding protein [Eggerthella sp. YY7918]BAK44982.1 hypothetical protein EGYY_18490 [Eggerthella sp. YY7918]